MNKRKVPSVISSAKARAYLVGIIPEENKSAKFVEKWLAGNGIYPVSRKNNGGQWYLDWDVDEIELLKQSKDAERVDMAYEARATAAALASAKERLGVKEQNRSCDCSCRGGIEELILIFNKIVGQFTTVKKNLDSTQEGLGSHVSEICEQLNELKAHNELKNSLFNGRMEALDERMESLETRIINKLDAIHRDVI